MLNGSFAVPLFAFDGADQNVPENVKAAFDKVKASAEEGNADDQVHLAWWYYWLPQIWVKRRIISWKYFGCEKRLIRIIKLCVKLIFISAVSMV